MLAINELRASATASAGGPVLSMSRGPALGVLPDADAARIHEAVLEVLADLGAAIGSPALLDGLAHAGADVDATSERARFPRELVEETLRRTHREIVLAAREPGADLRVGGREGWLGAGGPAELVVDPTSDARRPSTLADVQDAARLADATPQLGFLGPCVAALDLPADIRAPRDLHARLASTAKHVQVEVPDGRRSAEAVAEIARAVSGGAAELRARPVVSAVLRTVAPLRLEGGRLEGAVALAEAGIPCGVVAAPVAGVTAPASVAGVLVIALAEAVAGIVTIQALVPGAPVFLGADALRVPAGERASVPGGPSDPLFQLAWVQLVRELGLPAQVGAFSTGSRSSDWQAGLEGGLSATASWMAGPDLLASAGMRDGGRVFSPAALLLDAELFDLVRRIPLGFAADDEALAVELIEDVGPGGHFLGEAHTLRHMREAWMARFMDTQTWEAWEEAGRPQPAERARATALEILSGHEPPPLDAEADARIREVIAEHERTGR